MFLFLFTKVGVYLCKSSLNQQETFWYINFLLNVKIKCFVMRYFFTTEQYQGLKDNGAWYVSFPNTFSDASDHSSQ